MRPDPLSEAAARRHELTRAKAIQALRELDRAGTPVTFAAVASAARISRSWLYTQPDIGDHIRRLRRKTDGAGSAGAIPAGQRATDASLRARLTAALARCYRPRYLNIQRLNYLWTIRHSSARIAGNLIT